MSGEAIEEAMADLAFLFHWPVSEMDAMPVAELMAWHRRALARLKATLPKGPRHG
jgi:hypothetical protein